MDARYSIEEARKKKKAEQKEVKQQPYHFKSRPSPAPFDKLPEDVASIVLPLLSPNDKSNLMQVSQNIHLLFRKTFVEDCLTQLLQHVIYGEPAKAEAMIEKNPLLLLQTGCITLNHTGQRYEGTALRIACCIKDEEMVAIFQRHMDIDEIKKQMKAQFPDGYEAYKIAESERIRAGFKILEDTFEAIADAKIEADDQDNLIIGERAKLALDQLRDYLKPKNVIETGEDFTDILVQKAFELYDANYDRFSIPAHTYDSPKNMLAWRQVVGICERYLPVNYIQDFRFGLSHASAGKNKGNPLSRLLEFIVRDGDKYVKSNFLTSMVSKEAGLGFSYGMYGGGLCSSQVEAWGHAHESDFYKTYVSQKHANLQKIHSTQWVTKVKQSQ